MSAGPRRSESGWRRPPGPPSCPGSFTAGFANAFIPWPDGYGGLTKAGIPVSARTEKTLAKALAALCAEARATMADAAADAVRKGMSAVTQAGFAADPAKRTRMAHHMDRALADPCRADAAYAKPTHLATAVRDGFAAALKAMARERADADVRGRAGLDDYVALFPVARSMRRRMVLHLGPTNSGKTHAAMEYLATAATGTYLSPLRLMALEAFDRLTGRDVPTRMVTGEERIGPEGATHVASTVEMVDTERPVDVAVVDEARMILDPGRGWAWTQAIVGVPAGVLHLTGSADCLAHVTRIAALTGDEPEVVAHERLTPLVARKEPIADIRDNDAVIAFSRADVLRLREARQEDHAVATIYGALGPEVRRSEAARFRSGEARVLVATDAVAMGLNLPIRRILFHRLTKFDGVSTRRLTGAEIRQIAGRAGRHGFAESGVAGVLASWEGGEERDGSAVGWALDAAPVAPTDLRLPVMPPWRAVKAVSERDGTEDLCRILTEVARLLAADPLLATADLEEALAVARIVARSGLTLRDRFRYLGVPVDLRSEAAAGELAASAGEHGDGRKARVPSRASGKVPDDVAALQSCEDMVKRMTTYLWLSERWPECYAEAEAVRAERRKVNGLIEKALASKALARRCGQCQGRLPPMHRFPICDPCHRGRHRRHDHDDDDGYF